MDPNYPNPYPPYTYPHAHAHAHASPPSSSPDSYPPPPSAPDLIPIPQSHHHHHPSPSLDSAPQQSHPYPPPPPPYLQSSNSLPHHHHHHPSFHPQQFHSFQYPPPPQHNNNNYYYYNPYPLSPQTHYPPQQHYYNPSDHLAQINLSAADHDNGSSHNRNPTPTHTLTPLYRTQSHSFSSSSHGTLIPCSAPPPALPIVPYGGGGSLKVLLLHGNLDIWVCEARYLPNLDMFSKRLGDVLGKRLSSVGKLEAMTSDPYVSILVGGASVARTYVVSNNEHPVWMQHFNVPVAHHSAEIEFVIKDNDIVGSQLIGTVDILAEHIYSGRRVEGIYPVLGTNGKPCRLGATLRISMQYVPIERMTTYLQGVGGGPEYEGVVGTYFPLRKGGRVTLYQDAHVPDGFLPDLRLEGDRHYEHGKCWVDMLEAMSQAKRLIYITGWSVFHTVQLVRDAGSGKGVTLGELLKSKSQERVRVLLLVWDDPTSRSILGYKMNGIMGTQDEETRRFFKGTSVQVLLCPRSAGKKHSWAKQQVTF